MAIPKCTKLFIGQETYLNVLSDTFSLRDSDSEGFNRRSFLLYGLGGIGKTEICLKFIKEYSSLFSQIFWINASSEETIIQSLLEISNTAKAQSFGVQNSAESALQWISKIKDEWLMVFDHAGTSGTMEKFLPGGNSGNILITSQRLFVGWTTSFSNCMKADVMEKEDAITLLLVASGLELSSEIFRNAAKDIVDKLCYIPLAIMQAGAAIQSGFSDIHKYQQHSSKKHQELLFDIWKLTLKDMESRTDNDFLCTSEAAQSAIFILKIFTFLNSNSVDKEIFCLAAKKLEEIPDLHTRFISINPDGQWKSYFEEGIELLLSFSMIAESGRSYCILSLVQTWIQSQMSHIEQQEKCSMAITILASAIEFKFQSQDYAFCGRLLPHIVAIYQHATHLGLLDQISSNECSKLALVFQENGHWNKAEELEMKVLEKRKITLGEDHPDTLSSMDNLVSIYHLQGCWKESELLGVEVVHTRRRVLGAEHPNTLSSMNTLASIYQNQGRWNEAEQLQTEVLETSIKVLGEQHPDTLQTMGNLASSYYLQGRWKDAEALQIKVLDSIKIIFGLEHLGTLAAKNNLASTYQCQGHWMKAEKLQTEVLDTSSKLIGKDHPDTLVYMGNLAVTYQSQGQTLKAEKLEIQVLDSRMKVLGPEHPATLSATSNLSSTYQSQGKWIEAEKLQVKVLDEMKKILGEDHPDTLQSMKNLAVTYVGLGNFLEAKRLQVQLLEKQKRIFGPEHPGTLVSMTNLALTYNHLGNWQEGQKLCLNALECMKKVLGIEHPDTLVAMENLALIFQTQGKWKDTEELQIQVLDIRKRVLGETHPDTIKATNSLALTYKNKEEHVGV